MQPLLDRNEGKFSRSLLECDLKKGAGVQYNLNSQNIATRKTYFVVGVESPVVLLRVSGHNDARVGSIIIPKIKIN